MKPSCTRREKVHFRPPDANSLVRSSATGSGSDHCVGSKTKQTLSPRVHEIRQIITISPEDEGTLMLLVRTNVRSKCLGSLLKNISVVKLDGLDFGQDVRDGDFGI